MKPWLIDKAVMVEPLNLVMRGMGDTAYRNIHNCMLHKVEKAVNEEIRDYLSFRASHPLRLGLRSWHGS